jgi:hypothetical protein
VEVGGPLRLRSAVLEATNCLLDRIYRIYQIFSQFPDETEKGYYFQKTFPVYPVDPV